MPEPVVLVLGCGIGGVVAARQARRLLPSSHRVIVVDRQADASYPPSYLRVVMGERRPESIRKRRNQLGRGGIEFVNAEVRLIDLTNRHVRAGSREFHYDYLIVALGAETNLDTRPGLAEAAHSFYTLEGAERLAATLRYFAGGRILIAIAGLPYKSSVAPYEAAMLLEHHFHDRRMRQNVEIAVYTPEAAPLAVAGRDSSAELMGLLAHKGIELHARKELVSVEPHRREARFGDGETAPFQLLIAVPAHAAPAVVQEAGLVDESGWVSVDARTMETQHKGVYAVGDLTYIQMPDGAALPKEGVFAERQAEVAARNIAYQVGGGPAPDPFDGRGRLLFDIGAGAASMLSGDFMAAPRRIEMKQPSIVWHWAKASMEKWWLWRWGR